MYKMKANELMVGDFVMMGKKTYRCANICGHTNDVLLDNGVITNVGNLTPIPLTPEILEKNGFERCVNSCKITSIAFIPICDSNQFCHKNLGNLRIIDRHPCHGWTLRTDVFGDTCHNEIHHINYVHELQHALKLLKIEKTIEL